MKILVTGAKGFVGRNLVCNLRNIMEGKNRTRSSLKIEAVLEYDVDTDPSLLEEYCAQAGFVFNLAGVNRPKGNSEFMDGNYGFASRLLDTLRRRSSVGTDNPITENPSWPAKNCFFGTDRKPAPERWSTGFPICSGSGADRIITARWRRSAAILQTICRLP